MRVRLSKYHALGNDYLVVERDALRAPLVPAAVRRICDRHRGVGADGILVYERDGEAHRLRIWNPDGSEAEKSGNGLRILARWLFDRGRVGVDPFEVHTPGGAVICRVAEGGRSVQVEMGRVSFDSPEIPVTGPRREVLDEPLALAGETLRISAATIGNPHCVVLRESLSVDDVLRLGPLLERHPLFPQRTNVQLVRVDGSDRIAMEIWERGAGHTLASGSSACAAAAVMHRLGRCGRHIAVAMPGGELAIEIRDGCELRMTGPVTAVAEIELNAEALEGV